MAGRPLLTVQLSRTVLIETVAQSDVHRSMAENCRNCWNAVELKLMEKTHAGSFFMWPTVPGIRLTLIGEGENLVT